MPDSTSEFRLCKVEYLLFDFEHETIRANPDADPIEIDGEVVMTASTGEKRHVSWLQGGDSYFVSVADRPFFCDTALLATIDVTDSAIWRPLIGTPVSWRHQDQEKEILIIECGSRKVFCCAFGDGRWGNDVTYLGSNLPPFDDYRTETFKHND